MNKRIAKKVISDYKSGRYSKYQLMKAIQRTSMVPSGIIFYKSESRFIGSFPAKLNMEI